MQEDKLQILEQKIKSWKKILHAIQLSGVVLEQIKQMGDNRQNMMIWIGGSLKDTDFEAWLWYLCYWVERKKDDAHKKNY